MDFNLSLYMYRYIWLEIEILLEKFEGENSDIKLNILILQKWYKN